MKYLMALAALLFVWIFLVQFVNVNYYEAVKQAALSQHANVAVCAAELIFLGWVFFSGAVEFVMRLSCAVWRAVLRRMFA